MEDEPVETDDFDADLEPEGEEPESTLDGSLMFFSLSIGMLTAGACQQHNMIFSNVNKQACFFSKAEV